MSSRLYPEWFIDGPWHGEDKRKKCPHLQGMVRCVVPRPINVRELLNDAASPIEIPLHDEYIYVPKWVDVFGERILVWVGEIVAGTTRADAYPDWVRMLGQLVMAPHRLDVDGTPYNVGAIAQRHRERWDIEHEIRREVRHEIDALKGKIQALEVRLRRANTAYVLSEQQQQQQRLNTRLDGIDSSAACIEIKDEEGERYFVRFENIVLYLDDGDGTEENPPAWVATAQGPIQSGSDHSAPCTGYGTTKKAAIIALLADGLGVYSRMIDIGERMK